MRIFKYILGHTTTLELPEGAELITIQIQGDDLCAWFKVDPDIKTTFPRKFVRVATGQLFNETLNEGTYITTLQDGPFVWHIYEI